jgi:hypothetical protein
VSANPMFGGAQANLEIAYKELKKVGPPSGGP